MFAVIKNQKQVAISDSLRVAKDKARNIEAEFVVEFSLDLMAKEEKIKYQTVYIFAPHLKVYWKYSYEEYLKLSDRGYLKHLANCPGHSADPGSPVNTLVNMDDLQ